MYILPRRARGALALVIALGTAARADDPPAYRVRFRDAPERAVLRALRERCETYILRDRPPPTDGLLRQRAEQDLPVVRDALYAAGYYGADPRVEIVTSAPRRVVFHLNPGPRYRLGEVVRVAEGVTMAGNRAMGWRRNMPARASALLEAEQEWLAHVRAQGFPTAKYSARRYTPDHERRRLHVRLEIDPGPPAVWGETAITGAARVREDFIRNELSLIPGEPYDPARLDESRARLMRLGLFSSVALAPGAAPDEEGRLPVELAVRERRPRTVAAGVRFTTDEGWGTRAEWEHRNLGGRAERLRLAADYGEALRALDARLAMPQFGLPRQRLLLSARAAEESPDAFDSRSLRSGAMLEREWRQVLWVRGGVAFRLSAVDQFEEDENYVFLSLPLETDWNTSGNPLDPRGGFRLFARAEPFFDVEERDRGFFKSTATLNRYQRLNRERTWILAGRATAGSIVGAGASRVPADERFYAGGGGSVRGYAYQSVGPLRDDEPLGGRSLLEVSGELRAQATESLGVVLFLDGGTAYEEHVPDFDEPFRWGAGVGLRYFTAVGPLRADFAFPLDRREGIDKSFQFYFSLGQAF
jgi:translocation and assembly module TamA